MEQITDSCRKQYKTYFHKLSDIFWNKPMKVKNLLNPPEGQPQWKWELAAILRLASREGYLSAYQCEKYMEDADMTNDHPLLYTKKNFALLGILEGKLSLMDPEEYL